MKRQLVIILLLLLGIGALNAAGNQRSQAAASSDGLEWLGPLPARISDASLDQRWDRLIKQVFAEVQKTDPRSFQCKSPAEVGPVPMMSAVERYIDGAPESRFDNEVMGGLYEAAAKGNWLARTLIFFQLIEYSENALQYRAVALGEWMHERRLGQLYAGLGDMLKGSGYYGDLPGVGVTGFDIAAAVHHSYVAQNEVGKELSKNDDPELAAIGRKMLACASSSLGAYRRLFSREAAQIRKR